MASQVAHIVYAKKYFESIDKATSSYQKKEYKMVAWHRAVRTPFWNYLVIHICKDAGSHARNATIRID